MDNNSQWHDSVAKMHEEIALYMDSVEKAGDTTMYLIASSPEMPGMNYHSTYGVLTGNNDDLALLMCTAYAALGTAMEHMLELPDKSLNEVTTRAVKGVIDTIIEHKHKSSKE